MAFVAVITRLTWREDHALRSRASRGVQTGSQCVRLVLRRTLVDGRLPSGSPNPEARNKELSERPEYLGQRGPA